MIKVGYLQKKDRNVTEGGVEVSLNPEELDMQDQKGLERKYEEQLRKQAKGKEEDFSDMVAEHSAKQNVGLVFLRYSLRFYLVARPLKRSVG